MDLMDVERMQLRGAILDDPILDVALLDDNVRHARRRIEWRGRLAVHRDEKSGRTIGIIRVEKFFREVEPARSRRGHASQPWKSGLRKRLR